ncbi:hypothetical protein PVAND_014113 [Polypedilum vanderplanki]|uniref:Peptidase S1 domain-containing protein n=1 Tax=Polypedilum vanderplanki TaxID=319348 RepID=A0A9J6CSQ2_POLVA|nr:hypothetical protein PVAND_014113 [Polypedilum vanderplanki]
MQSKSTNSGSSTIREDLEINESYLSFKKVLNFWKYPVIFLLLFCFAFYLFSKLNFNSSKYNSSIVHFKNQSNGIVLCNANLINNRMIITSAHCPMKLKSVDIYLEIGDKIVKEYYEINHPDFVAINNKNDIRIVIMAEELKGSYDFFQLPIDDETLPKILTAILWDMTSNFTQYRESKMQVVDLSKCQELWKNASSKLTLSKNKYKPINSNQICTWNAANHEKFDSFQGDSGMPLIEKKWNGQKVLHAIVSYGHPKHKLPNINTKIQSHLKWIKEVESQYIK